MNEENAVSWDFSRPVLALRWRKPQSKTNTRGQDHFKRRCARADEKCCRKCCGPPLSDVAGEFTSRQTRNLCAFVVLEQERTYAPFLLNSLLNMVNAYKRMPTHYQAFKIINEACEMLSFKGFGVIISLEYNPYSAQARH